jgi:hypothetical protein
MTEDTTTAGRSDAGLAPGQSSNGLAIAGLVCGLVGTLFFNVILGPLAIIFGGVGLSRANRGARHRGMAIAAIVLGVIDLIIFGVLLIVAAKHGGSMFFHVR